jgi:hypothetical protein
VEGGKQNGKTCEVRYARGGAQSEIASADTYEKETLLYKRGKQGKENIHVQ